MRNAVSLCILLVITAGCVQLRKASVATVSLRFPASEDDSQVSLAATNAEVREALEIIEQGLSGDWVVPVTALLELGDKKKSGVVLLDADHYSRPNDDVCVAARLNKGRVVVLVYTMGGSPRMATTSIAGHLTRKLAHHYGKNRVELTCRP